MSEVAAWLLRQARETEGRELRAWRRGIQAAIPLKREKGPCAVFPDAWFVFQINTEGRVLVGLIECDRASERGEKRWQEKIAAYTALFAGSVLK